MKKRGYLFTELAVVMGLFSVVIFPLVMLTDKNIKNLNFIKEDYEIRKLTKNLEVVFEKILKNDSDIENINFSLARDKNETGTFILLKGKNEKITKLRNIKINSDVKIFLRDRKIFVKESGKEIGRIFVLEIETEGRLIKKILSVENEKI